MTGEPAIEIDLVRLLLAAVEQIDDRSDRALLLRFLTRHLDGVPVRVRVRLLDVIVQC